MKVLDWLVVLVFCGISSLFVSNKIGRPGDEVNPGSSEQTASKSFVPIERKLEKYSITARQPIPSIRVGLYLYVLPGGEVDRDVLKQIADFQSCLPETDAKTPHDTVALLILPVRFLQPREIDLSLSKSLLLALRLQEEVDDKEVYLFATDSPIVSFATPPKFTEIRLGRIAPEYVGTWLSRLQTIIEAGDIRSPSSLDLSLRSVLTIVGSVGEILGVTPAHATEFECSAIQQKN